MKIVSKTGANYYGTGNPRCKRGYVDQLVNA